jgi:gas vesicle protein
MDTMSLIGGTIGAQTGMMQLAVAARLARMNNADISSSIAQLVGSADQNANSLANVAGNIGTNLDVSA